MPISTLAASPDSALVSLTGRCTVGSISICGRCTPSSASIGWCLPTGETFFNGAIGSNPFPTPKGLERVLFWGGKAAWVVLWMVLPLTQVAVGVWLLAFMWTYLVLGFTLSIVFQLAHIAEEAEFPVLTGEPKADRSFFEHQLATTVNFAPKNRFLNWYLGGLNFQVEHHLFPKGVPSALSSDRAHRAERGREARRAVLLAADVPGGPRFPRAVDLPNGPAAPS